MASTKDTTTSQLAAQQRAKQERLRENQRRSRARRQEYLVELEQRLEECRVTCREANFLRQSFQELQTENEQLRGLLNNAGLGPDLVDSFLRQRSQQQQQQQQASSLANNKSGAAPASSTNLRHLKPRLTSPPNLRPADASNQPRDPNCHPGPSVNTVSSTTARSNNGSSNEPQAASVSSQSSSCCPPRSSQASSFSSPSDSVPPRPPLDTSDFLNQHGLPTVSSTDCTEEHVPTPSPGDPSALDWLFSVSESTWEEFVAHSAELFVQGNTEPNESNS